MVPRILAKSINHLIAKFPILFITGPRQSGKTTLLKSCLPKFTYVSLENPDNLDFATSDPRGFLSRYYKKCIIDEAQRAPKLFSYMQQVVDDAHEPGMFILSGSQNFLLMERISQSLAGRVAVLNLLPFDREELINGKLAPGSIEEALFMGAYPRLFDMHIEPNDFYPNYMTTYIERDVRQLKNVTDLTVFQQFIKLCAGRCGSLLNTVSLGNDCGITHNTVRSWLSLLEISFVVFLLPPYYVNFNKRIVKSPKLYFYDTGVACSLLGIRSADELSMHPMRGPLFENYVLIEFLKYYHHHGRRPELFFWRDKTGHEIDCIVEKGQKTIPVEIKSGQTVNDDYFKNVRYFNELSRKKGGFVIYGGKEPQPRTEATVLGWKDCLKAIISGT
ncbi:MAG: ATP-binding protein [Chitinispirillaceae bacterium]|nr:ATP-binding protein [Chitinispirillaceae bacterium]